MLSSRRRLLHCGWWAAKALTSRRAEIDIVAPSESETHGGAVRATHDLSAGDAAFLDLLERLRRGAVEFGEWWESHGIRSVASGRKPLHHSAMDLLHFEHASFPANDDASLKLVIYTPIASNLD